MNTPRLIQVWTDHRTIENRYEDKEEVYSIYGLFDDNQIREWSDGFRKWLPCYYTTEVEDE